MIPFLLFYKIAQLFCVMFLGFALVKLKVLKGSDSKALSKIALYILMPAVLVNSFDIELTPHITKGLILAFVSAILIHILLFAIDGIYHRFFQPSGAERASVIYSNAANLIIPIVSFILGEEWVIYTCAFVAVQILFIWTKGVRLFQNNPKTDYKKIVFNPCILAIFTGLILMVFDLRLPAFAKDITSSLGTMVGNVGMLISGMLMADVQFKKIFSSKKVYLATAMRLVVCPALILVLLKVILLFANIPDAKNILLIAYLASITPSASMVTQLSQVYGSGEDMAVAVNILTTLLCIATMPVFVMMF